MGDRTLQFLTIYVCPDNRVNAVLAILNSYGYEYETFTGINTLTDLELGHQYEIDEGSCGTADEVANQLMELGDVAYVVGEDPKYEYDGDLYRFWPDLGTHWIPTNSDGAGIMTHHALGEILAEPDLELDELRERFAKITGRAWNERVTAEDERIKAIPVAERTLKPWPVCDWCEEPVHQVDGHWIDDTVSVVCLRRVEAAGRVILEAVHTVTGD